MLVTDPTFFTEVTHTYIRNWVKIPSVTTILGTLSKDWLLPWAVKTALETLQIGKVITQQTIDTALVAHKVITQEAGEEGTLVHQAINDYVHGKEVNCESLGYKAFLSFVHDHKPKILMSEQMVYNEEMEYAGTFDVIMEVNGKRYIGDWKTSKSIYGEYLMQLAGYVLCLPDMIHIDGFAVVHLDKFTGKYEIVLVDNKEFIDSIKEWFKSCVQLFKLRKELNSLVNIVPASREKRFGAITLKN